ncbi:MAG: hypothetical protein ACRYF3_12170, partial [Janthinobacterium lividum]
LGRGDSMSVYVFYLPPGTQWAPETTFAEARRHGLTFLWLQTGYGAPWSGGTQGSADISRDPSSGDSMTVVVGSTAVGVQYQAGVTRLAWSYRSEDAGVDVADYNITVMSAHAPRASVELLMRDRAIACLG